MFEAAEQWAGFRLMRGDEIAHLVDGPDAVRVAFVVRASPGEEAVTTEQDTIAPGMIFDGFCEL